MATATAATRLGLHKARARIIALPLVRKRPVLGIKSSTPPSPATPGSSASTLVEEKHKFLTYYQFQLSSAKKAKANVGAEVEKKEGTTEKGWLASKIPEEGIPAYAQTKASDLWASFGKAEGGWKLKVFQLGERAMDRIDYEELALKSVDPSLGPSISHPKSNVMEKEEVAEEIPLLYAPSITTPQAALEQLKAYAAQRAPIHRRGFYTWAIIAPFTAPFMIIPVIPNLPFFFCVWRSWSHYKAWRSSQYLQGLLDQGRIVPEASEALDSLYEKYPPSTESAPAVDSSSSPSTSPSSSSSAVSSSSLSASSSKQTETEPETETDTEKEKEPDAYERLLSKHAIPPLLTTFELGSNAEADLYRAVEQARVRIKTGKVSL